ncbi:selenocysteine-specific translation elongation factor [Streptomyces sp. NBC_01754]|uniref:selenocysteine-specific translation elongation factor n=1 Tax=Streptomyces sp. NBC_01754 TaxID=2975930 RepID=UPI002DDACCB9|nr:selenocysteine-specific translation elongation factor [Streptomyces sp. NBC_01754]WSC93801.1 selenocysteine-specific translation elongation factor [Streptomyces sp. NBC_01754]
MRVIATAGHVDHGKSTLVQALTGTHPDRLAEEQLRGMTIDLGFAWMDLPSRDPANPERRDERLAFVDVPGHERFITTMVAGAGPVPAALFVVAADEGWMPQSAEHLAVLDALEVRHGLLAVTRSDLADPSPAREEALAQIRATSLGDVEAVTVSGVTGKGLPELRDALARLVSKLPGNDPEAPVRLWLDRAFTINGSGLVVTGTLNAGRIRTGDSLFALGTGRPVRVRSIQTLGQSTPAACGTARVALNLRGVNRDETGRGDVLLTPGAFLDCSVCDVRVHSRDPLTAQRKRNAILHIGSAAVPVHVRPLGEDTARLTLSAPLPLRIGDRAVLRDPGRRGLSGVTLLDVQPPELRRRGAAAHRGATLRTYDGTPREAVELRQRLLIRRGQLEAMGVPIRGSAVVGDWLVHPPYWESLRSRLAEEVEIHTATRPSEHGLPIETARQKLDLPDRALVVALIKPPLSVRDGRIISRGTPMLSPQVAAAVKRITARLAETPFAAPETPGLLKLGLRSEELAAANRAGSLLRLTDQVVLLPDAPAQALRILTGLQQPFSVGEAARALGTTRRVVVPLLEHCDRIGLMRRHTDSRRSVKEAPEGNV